MRTSGSTAFLAHVRQDESSEWYEHSLEEHIRGVATLAGHFAGAFHCQDWARLAGLWHDLGKYSTEFQCYIRSASGYDAAEAHIEQAKGRVDHSTAGAIHAVEKFGVPGRVLAYLIAGHHAGLPDWSTADGGGSALQARIERTELLDRVKRQLVPDCILDQQKPAEPFLGGKEGFALWIRMLFSCLTDADFLDTEAFMDAEKSTSRMGFEELESLLPVFDAYMDRKASAAAQTTVNDVRAGILHHCRDASKQLPGLFSLTVPTGGGKALSSMAFALNHGKTHGKSRIIYAIPYTSIIEQTANIFRDIFGENVVEHHSNLDPDQETAKSRLACENWDAPIIVTTNVQFFESLFAARTSRTRKLHNIANSIVILDEAQLLPPEFLEPILLVMNLLTTHYGVTFVLSTATQPALNARKGFGWQFKGLENVREIMPNPDELYTRLERVSIQVPADFNQQRQWDDLAEELKSHGSVLCIVNTRQDCHDLHALMPKGTVHLSALMCGEHRSQVIAAIKKNLEGEEVVRVISTQLVEAGVDLDFPVVYRAMAGLDSIAQAAGRCNREGKLARGKVVVFSPPKQAPVGLLRKAEQCAINVLAGYKGNPLARDLFQQYFEQFYGSTVLDKHGICELLKPGGGMEVQFRTAAEKFRLIEESGYQSVIVRYCESPALLGLLRKDGPQRWLMRKLQRYSVSLPPNIFKKLQSQGDIVEFYPGIFAQAYDGLYHPEKGFLGDKSPHDPTAYLA